jgi:hypothetical protein
MKRDDAQASAPCVSHLHVRGGAHRIRLLKKQKRVAVRETKELRKYSKQELEELKVNRKLTNIIGKPTKKNIRKELGLVLPHFAAALVQDESAAAKSLSNRLFPARRR